MLYSWIILLWTAASFHLPAFQCSQAIYLVCVLAHIWAASTRTFPGLPPVNIICCICWYSLSRQMWCTGSGAWKISWWPRKSSSVLTCPQTTHEFFGHWAPTGKKKEKKQTSWFLFSLPCLHSKRLCGSLLRKLFMWFSSSFKWRFTAWVLHITIKTKEPY